MKIFKRYLNTRFDFVTLPDLWIVLLRFFSDSPAVPLSDDNTTPEPLTEL